MSSSSTSNDRRRSAYITIHCCNALLRKGGDHEFSMQPKRTKGVYFDEQLVSLVNGGQLYRLLLAGLRSHLWRPMSHCNQNTVDTRTRIRRTRGVRIQGSLHTNYTLRAMPYFEKEGLTICSCSPNAQQARIPSTVGEHSLRHQFFHHRLEIGYRLDLDKTRW